MYKELFDFGWKIEKIDEVQISNYERKFVNIDKIAKHNRL